MASATITSTTNSIRVEFFNTSYVPSIQSADYSKGIWRKDAISNIIINDTHVDVIMKDKTKWILSDTETENGLKINSINGVLVTSLDDLYSKLSLLIE